MHWIIVLLVACVSLTAEEKTPAQCQLAVEQLTKEIRKRDNLLKHQFRGEAYFTLHQHPEAIDDLSYVIKNLMPVLKEQATQESLQEQKMLLRCLCVRHLSYSLSGEDDLAAVDLEQIKPLLKNPRLKEEFPDYIEGLQLLITHEEAKKD